MINKGGSNNSKLWYYKRIERLAMKREYAKLVETVQNSIKGGQTK